MSFLTLAPTFWLHFLCFFDPRPSLPSSCLLFSVIKWQKKKNKKVAQRRLLTSHLYTSLSLSLPVSLYPHSFLNQEKVAWARPGVCQKIILPVWVPAPGLWLAAWRQLCSWLSMPYRSAGWGWGGGLFTTPTLRRLNLWDLNDNCEWRKTKGKEKTNRWGEEKNVENSHLSNLSFIQSIVRRDCDAALGSIKVRGRGKDEGWYPGAALLENTIQKKKKKAGGPKLIMAKIHLREGMNNIIKRRQDW